MGSVSPEGYRTCLKMGLLLLKKKKKGQEFGMEKKLLCQFSACISIPSLITSLFVVIAHLFIPVPLPLWLKICTVHRNHSSCTCKQLSYFHFCSSSNPVGQTTASDQKHTCKLTFTEAHSGNKSPTFLWFLSLKPKHRGFILCFFSSLYM